MSALTYRGGSFGRRRLAFAQNRKPHCPLPADFEPKGAVSRLYGAYQQAVGESARALFVIDPQSIIRWSYHSPVGITRAPTAS